MLETLDDAAVHRWCGSGLAALRAHQHEIDELNVFPVPDGDTGTNLVLTLTAAAEALEAATTGALEAGTSGSLEAGTSGSLEAGTSGSLEAGTTVALEAGTSGSLGAETAGAIGAATTGALTGEIVDAEPGTPLGRAMRRMARGALLGARGNSGVIVSQILRGMADSFATAVAVRGGELARALRTASEAAYAAVARPVEGTVLSVVAAAADGAGRIKSDDLVAVARAAARSATEALARTPQQLPVLARAGVVDAGGRGLCLLLDALVEALTGAAPVVVVETAIMPVRREAETIRFGYEVQYLLDASPEAVETLRMRLDGLGDSLVIVGTGEGAPPTWNVHVHVDDIGAAVEAGIEAGRPHRIAVTRLEDRLHADAGHHELSGADIVDRPDEASALPAAGGSADLPAAAVPAALPADLLAAALPADLLAAALPADLPAADLPAADLPASALSAAEPMFYRRADDAPAGDTDKRGAVVVAAGDGLTALFAAEGATVVDRNPSIAEIVDAITATGAGRVVLLPNDANTHAVATAAAREAAATGVRVSVVPTRSPVQALAALAVRDTGREFVDEVIAMAEAAGACRYGEVCTAQREALTVAGRCRPGDLLGLVDGEVHIIGDNLTEVSRRLIDRMLGGGGELTTLVLGADAPAELEASLRGHVCRTWPFVELQCYAGGQPRYHLLVGVE